MDTNGLKLELIGFVIATNLVSFCLGMLLVMAKFDVIAYLQEIELYLLLVILFGAVWLVYWTVMLIRKTNELLD